MPSPYEENALRDERTGRGPRRALQRLATPNEPIRTSCAHACGRGRHARHGRRRGGEHTLALMFAGTNQVKTMTIDRACITACAGVVLLALLSCNKSATVAVDGAPATEAKNVVQLPPPFSDIRLGMTQADLAVKFPASEDLSHCELRLVGGDRPEPPKVPGADKKARSRCARAVEIGGPTIRDVAQMITTLKELGANDDNFADELEAAVYSWAQVRGAVRAGALPEASVIEADRGHGDTAYGALTDVADALFRGGYTFATSHQARREVSAVIADGCGDVDADRVRKYFDGGYSLAQIDADAHSRVVYGKCRGPFLSNEKQLQRDFARRTGAFGGIGLARASRPDHQLKPDDPSTFAVYSSRSKVDTSVAKLGVAVANVLPAVETHWQGTVGLLPAEAPDGGEGDVIWSRAVVWLRDGHVARVLLNLTRDGRFADAPKALADFYKSPGTTAGTVTKWSLADGTTVTLDIGAATSVVVENPGTSSVTRSAEGTPAASASSAAAPSPPPSPAAAPPAPSTAPDVAPAARVPVAPAAPPGRAPAPPAPAVNPALARTQQCCAALRTAAQATSGKDAKHLTSAAGKCDAVVGQVVGGAQPDFSAVHQALKGRSAPAACAGM